MYDEKIVLCGANSYEEKYYLNPDFSELPDSVKNELKIMYYLFEHAGTICTRADLIEYLWDNQLYVDDNALSVNIGRIREKLSKIGVKDFIKTKHRQGYTL